MNAMTTFDFEDHAVRVSPRGDQEFWFVAVDVCRILGLKNSRDAIAKLDDDERSDVGLTDTRSKGGAMQARRVNVISEAGLYTLILRCDEAMTPGTLPWRFRRWVTHDLLPTLRRTGSYQMGDPEIAYADPSQSWEGKTPYEQRTHALIQKEARLTYGPTAARAIWRQLSGLPQLPAGTAPSLPAGHAFDGMACLAHLLAAQPYPKSAVTVRDEIRAGGGGLGPRGILVTPPLWPDHVAVARRHKVLDRLFALTEWAPDWSGALLTLPGARATPEAVHFPDRQRRAVLVPLALCVGDEA